MLSTAAVSNLYEAESAALNDDASLLDAGIVDSTGVPN